MTDKDLPAFFGLELAKIVVDECFDHAAEGLILRAGVRRLGWAVWPTIGR